MSVLLLSTYDLGRQSFGLASPAAWIKRAGIPVSAQDLSRDTLDADAVRHATLIAFYLPMHTATRLAVPVIDRVRTLNPAATLAAYGLYARLSETLLRQHGVSVVLGPEAEEELATLASADPGVSRPEKIAGSPNRQMPRLSFITPDRSSLPSLARYATLQMPDGSQRIVGATEATRGCKHRCRHCPIVPVYDGQFRAVPVDVVLADIDQQVAAGAEHITFGDPDFFNGPSHARRIVERLHARYPDVSYDATIKVEHLLQHAELLPILSRTGCVFITSAVESVDDTVLAKLDKGHTRAGFVEAVGLCHEAGIVLVPTFVAFTPWTTAGGFVDLLQTIEHLGLVEHVAPVQWGLRLLITEGSRLLELDDIGEYVSAFDPATLTYPWRHRDPRLDRLQVQIMQLVGVEPTHSRMEVFEAVTGLAGAAAGVATWPRKLLPSRSTIPYLDEPWFC